MNAAALCLLLASVPQTPGKPVTADDIRAQLDALAPKHFRGMVYVEQAGKEVFFHTVGLANPEAKRPFTRETGICIGSIVKPMVRTALFRLVDEGKLSLRDPISKFIENVPSDKAGITLTHLADHTSGFQDFFGGDYEPMKRDELIGKMLASKLQFAPGAREEYSNSGFSMLATILEKTSGLGIEEFIARTQFEPIGLKKTGYVRPGWKKEDLVSGTNRRGEKWGTPLDRFWYPDGPSWNLRGNGGMISTVVELARWGRALNEGEILTKKNHRLMIPAFYEPDAERRLWGAAGGNGIFNTILIYNPGKRMVAVAASVDGRFEIESDRELIRNIYRMLPAL